LLDLHDRAIDRPAHKTAGGRMPLAAECREVTLRRMHEETRDRFLGLAK